MSERNTIRICPTRERVQRASAWRIWVQGNEAYISSRDMVTMGKISLHRNGHWLYRVGTSVRTLAPGLTYSGGWHHALQLTFLVDERAILPVRQMEARATLVEVPLGSKLVLNMLFSSKEIGAGTAPPYELGGALAWHRRLRSGAGFAVIQRILPQDRYDAQIFTDVRDKLRINLTKLPIPGDIFAEAIWQNFDSVTGNAIVIVPVTPEVLQGPPDVPAQPG